MSSCHSDVLMKMTRKPQFSMLEIAVLFEKVVENSKVQLFSKLKNSITNADKNKIWAEITQKINDASYGYGQSPDKVRNKWRDSASVTKQRAVARKREANKTDGVSVQFLLSLQRKRQFWPSWGLLQWKDPWRYGYMCINQAFAFKVQASNIRPSPVWPFNIRLHIFRGQ